MDTHKESTVSFMHVLLDVSLHRGSTDCCSLERGCLVLHLPFSLTVRAVWALHTNLLQASALHWTSTGNSWHLGLNKLNKTMLPLLLGEFIPICFVLVDTLSSIQLLVFQDTSLLDRFVKNTNSLKWWIPHDPSGIFLMIFVLFGNVSMLLSVWKVRTLTAWRCEKIDRAFSGCSS